MAANASCTFCGKIGLLEIWTETQQLLCKKCMVENFENWRKLKIRESYEIEGGLEVYKRKIDAHIPAVNQNLEQVRLAQESVEQVYASYIAVLNQEKQELMASLEHLKKESTKLYDFKNDLVKISQNLISFKDSSLNLYDDNVINNLVKQFKETNELAHKAHQTFVGLAAKPIRVLEKFEKMPTASKDLKHLGKCGTKDLALVNPNDQHAVNALSETFRHTDYRDTARHMQSAPATATFTGDNFKVWRARTDELPYEEITLDRMPVHLTSYRNYLFLIDDEDNVVVYAINSSNNFEYKNMFKMTQLTNIRGCAANLDHFAVTYSDLPKKYLKTKKYKPNGCVLFKRESLDSVQLDTEKVLGVDVIKNPVGVALNNECAFVCDKEARSVFKIDIRTNNLIKRVDFDKGEPYKLALNRNYLVVTDPVQHFLNIFEVETLAKLNYLCIEQPDGKNGPFGVSITDDNIIFAKNYDTSQLTLFNFNLNDVFLFKKLKPNTLHGFTMLQCFNQILVVGVIEKKNYKLLCYSNVNT